MLLNLAAAKGAASERGKRACPVASELCKLIRASIFANERKSWRNYSTGGKMAQADGTEADPYG